MTINIAPALAGDRFEIDSDAGRLNLYEAGHGPPLLLVHSINAAASAAEVRPLHEHYRRTRRVFSLDLPGFGFSERSDRVYSIRLMTDAIHAAVGEIRARCNVVSVDALALSLSTEFLARAAVESSQSFRSVALVSPTGFNGRRTWHRPAGSHRGSNLIYQLLRKPGWSDALYRSLTRPNVLRYFLRGAWGSKAIDDPLWQYDILLSRQPGAKFAPLYFLSAQLFSADIHAVYAALTLPVWVSHGVRGDFADYRQLGLVADRPNWRFSVYQSGAFPHFEKTKEFCDDYDEFL